ncbi:MAG: hypothetical protein SVV03_03450 [Candidatus Nanohaloarchaea archaeon]|nr:hypothetical protein [Candidatus Nanohaloarchaea archaeon]
MGEPIAEPGTIYLILLAIIAIPVGAALYFDIHTLSISASIILVLLIGLLGGSMHEAGDIDNISTIIVSLIIITILAFLLTLKFWHCGLIYLAGFMIGKELTTKRGIEIPGTT